MEEARKFGNDCPVATPSRSTVHARTLHRACEILGGVQQLAAQMKVSAIALLRWMEGEEDPPIGIFLAAVDIVLLHAGSAGRAN
jgi:hypothetical protein